MRRIAHAVVLAGMSAAGLGLLAAPATAHVTVSPATAPKGGYATLTFKVPTERAEASTTVLEVEFPEAYPFASISVQPKPGWDYKVDRANLPTPISNHGEQVTQRVSKVTWTAQGAASQIKPGEFDVFPISAGPLPSNTASMTFKALQTYSNGEIVRWIEEAAAGSSEPANPAPKLTLTDAGAEGASPGATATAAPVGGDVASAVAEAKAAAAAANKAVTEMNASMASSSSGLDTPTKNQVNTAVGLAIGAIVLALIGAGIGGAALARRPKDDDAPPPPVAPTSPPPAF